jgi:formaldehyde-activating enzyme involved in methanogenesis
MRVSCPVAEVTLSVLKSSASPYCMVRIAFYNALSLSRASHCAALHVLQPHVQTVSTVVYIYYCVCILQVGQMVFDPFVAVGGYVTDVLLTIQIDAKVSSERHVYLDVKLLVVA